jgi:hypothetical protein
MDMPPPRNWSAHPNTVHERASPGGGRERLHGSLSALGHALGSDPIVQAPLVGLHVVAKDVGDQDHRAERGADEGPYFMKSFAMSR